MVNKPDDGLFDGFFCTSLATLIVCDGINGAKVISELSVENIVEFCDEAKAANWLPSLLTGVLENEAEDVEPP